MGCASFLLLLSLMGASLAQLGKENLIPIFPMYSPITCYHTEILHLGNKLNSKPEVWTSSLHHLKLCESWEVCQETLLLVQTGIHSLIMGSKGCTAAGYMTPGVTQHVGPTGIVISSYIRFCNVNYCNNLNSTAPVLRPQPPPPVSVIKNPALILKCPTCLALYSCSGNTRFHKCSDEARRCYNGTIQIKGESATYHLGLLGCSTVASCELLLGIDTIGPFTLSEKCLDHHTTLWPKSQGAPGPGWAWALGLALFLHL